MLKFRDSPLLRPNIVKNKQQQGTNYDRFSQSIMPKARRVKRRCANTFAFEEEEHQCNADVDKEENDEKEEREETEGHQSTVFAVNEEGTPLQCKNLISAAAKGGVDRRRQYSSRSRRRERRTPHHCC